MGVGKYESGTLNKLLEEFYASVRKKDGEDNERDIFRVLIIAVDRYLIDKEYKNPIVRDGEFKSSNQILGKTSTTPVQGKGKRPNQWAMTRKKKITRKENRAIFWWYIINK